MASAASLRGMRVTKMRQVFLADDTDGRPNSDDLYSTQARPDTFTVADRMKGPAYLRNDERNWASYSRTLIQNCLMRQIPDALTSTLLDNCIDNLETLFATQDANGALGEQVTNQELPDVVSRVTRFTLGLHSEDDLGWNDIVRPVIGQVASRIDWQSLNLEDRLRLCIASGLIGLDMKGSGAAASAFVGEGINISEILTEDNAADAITGALFSHASHHAPIFHLSEVCARIQEAATFEMCWLTDDYIETHFDLRVIESLLLENDSLRVCILPKKGQHGNDASISDVEAMISNSTALTTLRASGRLRLSHSGPRMGTLALDKLSAEACRELARSDLIVVKGCRIHELIQGVINRPTWTLYVGVREFSQSESGYDVSKRPLLAFYLDPLERGYWGFRERHLRTTPQGDWLCLSTLQDHFFPADRDLRFLRSISLSTSQYADQATVEVQIMRNMGWEA